MAINPDTRRLSHMRRILRPRRPRPGNTEFSPLGGELWDLLRIHVDRDRDIAQGSLGGQGLDRVANRADRRLAIGCLEQDSTAVAVTDAEHRRRAKQVRVLGKSVSEGPGQLDGNPVEALL